MGAERLTDTEIIKRLCARLGWGVIEQDGKISIDTGERRTLFYPPDKHPLLEDWASLRRVLETLTEEEWRQVGWLTVPIGPLYGIARRLLTIPPRTLAASIAEVLPERSGE